MIKNRRMILGFLFILMIGMILTGCGESEATQGGNSDNGDKSVSLLDEIKERGELRVGWAEWEPFEYIDPADGELKGMLIKSAELIADELGVEVVYTMDQWSTLLTGVSTQKYDLAIAAITDERKQLTDFSIPMVETEFTAIVNKGSKYKSMEELLNSPDAVIGVTTGSNTDQVLSKMEKNGEVKAEISRIHTVGDGVMSVISNKSDAYTSTADSLIDKVESHPEELTTVEGNYGVSPLAVSIPKDEPEFLEAVNKAIATLIKNGEMAGLLEEYKVKGNNVSEVPDEYK